MLRALLLYSKNNLLIFKANYTQMVLSFWIEKLSWLNFQKYVIFIPQEKNT